MKKIIALSTVILIVLTANAQGDVKGEDTQFDERVFNVCATILVVIAFMVFILTIIKRILDYRLKNKIVDKGISENVASSILHTNTGDSKQINIKWFAILAGLGAGLMIVNYTMPLGIHSLAIMAFSISLSFLGYYFFLIRSNK